MSFPNYSKPYKSHTDGSCQGLGTICIEKDQGLKWLYHMLLQVCQRRKQYSARIL